MASKIIVVGPINGKFEVFEKLAKLHAKNTFAFAIILGDCFADPTTESVEDKAALSSLLNGEVAIPLPVYFNLGRYTLPIEVVERLEKPDADLCHNLHFLGKRSMIKTSEGLRIVSLGGTLDGNVTVGLSQDAFLPFHTEDDARALQGTQGTDILVTSSWPSMINSNSSVKMPNDSLVPASEQCVADLCTGLKPRYHFSPSDEIFYEREPFFHLTSDGRPDTEALTRFLSLAAFGNTAKQKWLYAFSIDPSAAPPTTLPAGTTATPLSTASRKRQRLSDQTESFSRFGTSSDHHRHGKRSRRSHRPPPTSQECFFCLSNPNLASHMITSIGNDAYLTTAKGPLSTSKTYDDLSFPAHILIMPLAHSSTLADIAPADTKVSTFAEMTHYRHALQRLLATKSRTTLGAVTWEISRTDGIHVHWQLLPISVDLISRGLVEAAFKVEAENDKYPPFRAENIGDGSDVGEDFFRVWIWQPDLGGNGEDPRATGAAGVGDDGMTGKESELILTLSGDFRFDLQFGRRVMAKLLGLETRLSWRDCGQEDEEEKKDANSFKEAFRPYDFSLDTA